MPNTNWWDDAPPIANPRKRKSAKIVREDDVEGAYTRDAEKDGALVLKVKVLGRPGYPDRWVLRDVDAALEQLKFEFPHLADEMDPGHMREAAGRIVAAMFRMAEFKKQANSVFQPKQKTILPMLRKRGFTVDIVHG